MIRALFQRLTQSSFARATAVLSSGQVLAAAIPILAAPILGRLYHPAEYGALGAYMAFANVLGALATLQLHQAVLLQKTDEDAHAVVSLVLTVSFGAAGVALLVALALFFAADHREEFAAANWWTLLLPFTVFATGQTGAVSMLANRAKRYGALARLPIINAVVIVSISIATGVLGWGVHGLFAGYAIAQLISYSVYGRMLKQLASHRRPPPLAAQWALAKTYRRFALFTAPSEIIGTFNMQAPIFALGALGASASIGAFTRARQLIGMPMQLMGGSIAQVFRQQAAQQRLATGDCRALYQRTGLMLLALGLPPTLFLVAVAPDLFRIVLGPNWESAGHLTRIIAPALLMQFICSPLSTVFYVMERQREEFGLAIGAFVLQVVAMAWGAFVVDTPEAILIGYTVAFCMIYLGYIVLGWWFSRPKPALAAPPRSAA